MNWTWHLIQFGWATWAVYWLIMALGARRTVERRAAVRDRLVVVTVVLAWLLIRPFRGSDPTLWPTHVALGIGTDLLFVAGAAFTVWARIVLGANWSSEVAFKQDQELVQTGPYAIVRHPIYTGLLTMALATAVNYGRVAAMVVFGLLCLGIWAKSRQEEKLMAAHFPEAYRAYRRRVHALVPFVL